MRDSSGQLSSPAVKAQGVPPRNDRCRGRRDDGVVRALCETILNIFEDMKCPDTWESQGVSPRFSPDKSGNISSGPLSSQAHRRKCSRREQTDFLRNCHDMVIAEICRM